MGGPAAAGPPTTRSHPVRPASQGASREYLDDRSTYDEPGLGEGRRSGAERDRGRAARNRRHRPARRGRQLPPAESRDVGRRPSRQRARPIRDSRGRRGALPAPARRRPRELAATLGAIGITFGVPGAYYLLTAPPRAITTRGCLRSSRGRLLLTAPVILWKARRSGGSRRRRYLRRALGSSPALLLLVFVVFPVGYSYLYTHTGRTATTPDLRGPYESVTVTTSDSLKLAASYVPSPNRAAVILFPGATRSDEARMLIRHGYGVLLLDPRGQGRSEGDTFAGPEIAICSARSTTCAAAATSIPTASAASASRSAARSCSKRRRSRPA